MCKTSKNSLKRKSAQMSDDNDDCVKVHHMVFVVSKARSMGMDDVKTSQVEHFHSFPWQCYFKRLEATSDKNSSTRVQQTNVGIKCNWENVSLQWKCSARVAFCVFKDGVEIQQPDMFDEDLPQIFGRKDEENQIRRIYNLDFEYSNAGNSWRIPNFLAWDAVKSDGARYVDGNGSINIHIYIRVKKCSGFLTGVEKRIDYEKKHSFADASLKFDDDYAITTLYVNKSILSFHSSYFQAQFFSDVWKPSDGEVVVKETNPYEFIEAMNIISGCRPNITDENVEQLLVLADKFLMSVVKNACEAFLLSSSELNVVEKFRLADTYVLISLESMLLKQLNKVDELQNFIGKLVKTEDIYYKLSETCRCALLERLVSLTQK